LSSQPQWEADQGGCAALIASARSGCGSALAELIGTYRSYLLLVANQELDPRLRGKVAASDVVQETCAEIARRFPAFRGDGEEEWRAWIRQMLLHDLQDARRRFLDTAKRCVGHEVPLQGSSESAGLRHDLPAPDPSPGSRLIAEEEAALLRAAMERLPEDYRQVIRLRNWQLLPFDEVGRQMSRSAEAARKLWARAIVLLQDELQTREPD
jgi:RNA polymerase sigma-70 factor (ECF subfamily)